MTDKQEWVLSGAIFGAAFGCYMVGLAVGTWFLLDFLEYLVGVPWAIAIYLVILSACVGALAGCAIMQRNKHND